MEQKPWGGWMLGLLGLTAVGLGCGATPDGLESSSQVRSSVTGSNSQIWDTATAPWGGVARLRIAYTVCEIVCPNGVPTYREGQNCEGQESRVCWQDEGGCSGSLIARDLVLTAAHCVCAHHRPPDYTIDEVLVNFPAMPSDNQSTTGWQQVDWTVDDCAVTAEDDASQDLAVVRLPGNVSETIVNSQLLRPYLGSDLSGFLRNDFTLPTVAGYGGGPEAGDFGRPLVFSAYSGSVIIDETNHWGLGISTGSRWIGMERRGASTWEGDSGGPLAVWKHSEQRWYQIGVSSATMSGVPFQSNRDLFSPTWNNGDGNGTWIAGFLDDADDDQVSDALDNCNPKDPRLTKCTDSQSACSNPTQVDSDGDGVGDACDNCPTYNPGQLNFDHDNLGDACDGCPEMFARSDDDDGDGVWDLCDNCSAFNNYSSCYSDVDCGGGFCRENGECSRQTDDADGDGVGGSCDLCPLVADADRLPNSNTHAETRKAADALQDICDPVPLYAVEPVSEVAVFGVIPNPTDGTRNLANNLRFTATAQIGHDTSSLTNPAAPDALPRKTYSGRVGFRYCDCDSASGPLGETTCIAARCAIDPVEYTSPDSSTSWKRVTVATSSGTIPALSADLARGAEFNRTYSSDLAVAPSFAETVPRLGALESLFWSFWKDLSSNGQGGQVPSRVRGGITQVNGILWSHTTGSGTSSTRDADTSKELRDSYTSVAGPYFHSEFLTPPLATCGARCGPWLDPGIWKRLPVFDPGPNDQLRPNDRWGDITRIRPGVEGIRGQQGVDYLDLADAFDAAVKDEMTLPDRDWLTPVEPTTDRARRNIRTVFASIESPWMDTSAIRAFDAAPDGNVSVRSLPQQSGVRPGARMGAQAVLSALEDVIYLVGGSERLPDGTAMPTSEIWRHELSSGQWSRLGHEGNIPGGALGDVVATAYDPTLRQLYVLSKSQNNTPFATTQTMLLTGVDTRLGTARTIARLPTLTTSPKIALAVTRDRTLVIGMQRDAQSTHLYEIDPRQMPFAWKGYAMLQGQLAGDLFAPGELFLPIANGGADRITAITRATLRQKLGAANAGDQDKDGIVDVLDDCPTSYNPAQLGCASPQEAVLYASSRLTLKDRVQVTGANSLLISAGSQPTTVGVDARIGSLRSRAAVTLQDRARAAGSIVSSGTVALGSGAGADGGIKPNVPLGIDPLSSFTVTFPSAGAPILLEPNQQRSIFPGSSGAVTLRSHSVLFLSAGDYYFQSFTVEPEALVVIDSTNGPVRIYVKSALTFRGSMTGQVGGAPKVLLAYLGASLATIDSPFDGTLVAPNAKALLATATHLGAFYAKEIEVQAGATVTYVPPPVQWFPSSL